MSWRKDAPALPHDLDADRALEYREVRPGQWSAFEIEVDNAHACPVAVAPVQAAEVAA